MSSVKNYLKQFFPNIIAQFQYEPETKVHRFPDFTSTLSIREEALLAGMESTVLLDKGQVLFQEGDSSDAIYLLLSGQVEVRLNLSPEAVEDTHTIATLQPGELVGDMGLIDEKPRSATVVAKTPVILKRYGIKDLKQSSVIYAKISHFIARRLALRLRRTNQVIVNHLDDNLKIALSKNILGRFTVISIFMLSLYSLLIKTFVSAKAYLPDTTVISVFVIVALASAITFNIKRSGLPLSFFGIRLKDWRENCRKAFWLTLPVLVLYLLIKWAFIQWHGDFDKVSLFDPTELYRMDGVFSLKIYSLSLLAYCLFSPAQELVARCGLQAPFYQFLPGSERWRKWNSILLSNCLFMAVHAHVSATFAVVAFFSGLYWGLIFHYQRSWIAVSLSHILIGVWITFIVGIPHFIIE